MIHSSSSSKRAGMSSTVLVVCGIHTDSNEGGNCVRWVRNQVTYPCKAGSQWLSVWDLRMERGSVMFVVGWKSSPSHTHERPVSISCVFGTSGWRRDNLLYVWRIGDEVAQSAHWMFLGMIQT